MDSNEDLKFSAIAKRSANFQSIASVSNCQKIEKKIGERKENLGDMFVIRRIQSVSYSNDISKEDSKIFFKFNLANYLNQPQYNNDKVVDEYLTSYLVDFIKENKFNEFDLAFLLKNCFPILDQNVVITKQFYKFVMRLLMCKNPIYNKILLESQEIIHLIKYPNSNNIIYLLEILTEFYRNFRLDEGVKSLDIYVGDIIEHITDNQSYLTINNLLSSMHTFIIIFIETSRNHKEVHKICEKILILLYKNYKNLDIRIFIHRIMLSICRSWTSNDSLNIFSKYFPFIKINMNEKNDSELQQILEIILNLFFMYENDLKRNYESIKNFIFFVNNGLRSTGKNKALSINIFYIIIKIFMVKNQSVFSGLSVFNSIKVITCEYNYDGDDFDWENNLYNVKKYYLKILKFLLVNKDEIKIECELSIIDEITIDLLINIFNDKKYEKTLRPRILKVREIIMRNNLFRNVSKDKFNIFINLIDYETEQRILSIYNKKKAKRNKFLNH